MKTTFHSLGAAALLGVATLGIQSASAQSVVETTSAAPVTTSVAPVTYMGTVSTFSPDVITVQGDSGQPIAYHYSKTTTYVDDSGAPVSMETVRSGLPVTVYYTQDGGNMVASKVIVRRIHHTSQ